MSSFPHIDNRKTYILILGRGPTQGLEHTLIAEEMYSINFTVTEKVFCLSLHYNGANSYLFVTGTEIYKFKVKDSEIVARPLCLGNISKDWSAYNMKRTGFNRYIYDFSIDYDSSDVDDIKDIHSQVFNGKEQNNIKMYRFIKQIFISTMMSFNSLSHVNSLEYILIKNEECKVRPEIVNINSNDTIFFPFSIK